MRLQKLDDLEVEKGSGGVRTNIRTVWIIEEGASEPRLITAYPIQKEIYDKGT